ncbi:MAG TPA: hypothetical protein VGV93_01835, partial [Acidimicrobiales bacterium]|nr:hypothetical protein [Acidimicrobiales bacterium]
MPPTIGSTDDDKTSAVLINPGGTTPGAPAGPSAPRTERVSTKPLPAHVITRYALTRDPDGNFCLRRVDTRRDTPMTEAEHSANGEAVRFANTAGVGRCPDEEGAIREVTPTQIAEP